MTPDPTAVVFRREDWDADVHLMVPLLDMFGTSWYEGCDPGYPPYIRETLEEIQDLLLLKGMRVSRRTEIEAQVRDIFTPFSNELPFPNRHLRTLELLGCMIRVGAAFSTLFKNKY